MEYKFETKTNKDGVITEVVNHQPEGYNPKTGIYASSYIFQGNRGKYAQTCFNINCFKCWLFQGHYVWYYIWSPKLEC